MPARTKSPRRGTVGSGSGFIDETLHRYRPLTPDIDTGAEIIPDWRKTRDQPIIRPGQLGGAAQPGSLKKGGKIKKTGLAKVHKGERVLAAKTAKKLTPAKLRTAARKPVPRRKTNR